MKLQAFISIFFLFEYTLAYLDIQLNINRTHDYISYGIPVKINDVEYSLSMSFCDRKQYIRPLSEKVQTNKKKKHKAIQNKQPTGVIKATSLQGYSFQGWKRFFMEAILFLQSRYYHDITINMSEIQKKSLGEEENYHDGIIKFGPNLADNKIFQLIRKNSEFAQKNIVSLYRGVNDKNVRVQLGGFEQSFARGLNNGILFYEMDILADDGKWKVPVKSLSCLKERNGKQDIFYVANSEVKIAISIQSPFLKLPKRFSSDVERNFESPHTNCKITQDSRLSCDNMTAIDLALNFIQFKIDDRAFINISLYDLRDSYDEKTKETVFFIQFVDSDRDIELGESLFKSYYVSIDMEGKKMLYSPLNRFPSQSYAKYLVRFLIAFGIFTIVVAFFAMLWQIFSDPFRKNKLMYSQDGVRLVSYQKPNEIEQ